MRAIIWKMPSYGKAIRKNLAFDALFMKNRGCPLKWTKCPKKLRQNGLALKVMKFKAYDGFDMTLHNRHEVGCDKKLRHELIMCAMDRERRPLSRYLDLPLDPGI